MALFNNIQNPYQRAVSSNSQMGGGGGGSPSGYESVTKTKNDKTMSSLMSGEYWMNGGGKGNMVTGLAVGGQNEQAAAVADKYGRSASNPWEAFISGVGGTEQEYEKNPWLAARHVANPNIEQAALASGIGGLSGYLGIPYISSIL